MEKFSDFSRKKEEEWKTVAERTQSGIMSIRNNAKAIDAMQLDVSDEAARYTREQILSEMQKSEIGRIAINHIANNNVMIKLINERQNHTNRGFQQGNLICIFLDNIKSERVGA